MQRSQNDNILLIREHINKLHSKGSADWESLSKQIGRSIKPMQYNLAQLALLTSIKPGITIAGEMSRAVGKSTGAAGLILETITDMPRSTNMLIGETYQQILTRTLPSTILGLEMHGIFKDLHYFVGREPPRRWKWPKAYQPPDSFDRYISFWTGAGYHLISQDKTGDGRGLNADTQLGDEAALLSKHKLDANTTPAMRGSNLRVFENKKTFGLSTWLSSTPLTPQGDWFINLEELSYQTPDKIKFIRADYRVNLHNLRKGYIDEAKAVTLPWIFDAEYRNIRPRHIKEGFYALLDTDVHGYNDFDYSHYQSLSSPIDCRGDADLVKGVPLTLGIDFGATINSLVICQNLQSINEFRALKSMFVLGENKEIIDDLILKFCSYYKYHLPGSSQLNIFYDNTGNNDTGVTRRTKAQQVADILIKHGWSVQLLTTGGANPQHESKHRLWEMMLRGETYLLPFFRINKTNCRDLWISMFNAKTKQGRSGIQKDKGSEKSKTILRQHATDLSDAIDAPVYGLFSNIIRHHGAVLPNDKWSAK